MFFIISYSTSFSFQKIFKFFFIICCYPASFNKWQMRKAASGAILVFQPEFNNLILQLTYRTYYLAVTWLLYK